MKKDIEWLKNGIELVLYRANLRGKLSVVEGNLIYDDILSEIDQLDDPEVLSQEWIDENKKYGGVHDIGYYIPVEKLQNLLVPNQELPVIPKFVAKYLEFAKSDVSLMRVMVVAYSRDELPEWEKEYEWISENSETFAKAWLNGYEVEEEPKYHALMKGHELVHDYDIYWNYDESNHDVFVSRLHPPLDNFTTEMSKAEWNKRGINDSNADFVKVDEQEADICNK